MRELARNAGAPIEHDVDLRLVVLDEGCQVSLVTEHHRSMLHRLGNARISSQDNVSRALQRRFSRQLPLLEPSVDLRTPPHVRTRRDPVF